MIFVVEIVNTHGTHGEVKAIHHTDGEVFFSHVKTLYKEDATPVKIVSWRLQKGSVLLLLDGINDMTAAEKLRFTKLYAREEDLPPLSEGKFYFFQLKGLCAVLPDGGELGTVSDVIENNAANLLEIKKPNGARVLIPNIPAFVKSVDIEKGTIYLTPIEGLIDNEI